MAVVTDHLKPILSDILAMDWEFKPSKSGALTLIANAAIAFGAVSLL